MTPESPWQRRESHVDIRICEPISPIGHDTVPPEWSPDLPRCGFLGGKANLGVWI
jgi:hypothetical protein